MENVLVRVAKDFSISEIGLLKYKGQIYVSMDSDIRREILDELHTTPYSLHPAMTKMYQDLRTLYWWSGMKRDVVDYVAKCLTCQQVKAEHQRPVGLLQPLGIPEWIWEDITMDFVVGLPKTIGQNDLVWVIVDRYTKSAYFLPVKTTSTMEQYAEFYVKEIVQIHGAPRSLVYDKDTTISSKFWESLQKALGTQLSFSTTYHP